jgi:methylated-DNA-[protein]-cysteine S-methyltransferase
MKKPKERRKLVGQRKKAKSPQSFFSQRVIAVVKNIPAGKTLSYQGVGERAGFVGAARAVGALMAKNLDPTIPCHRVIRSDGKIGGYNRGGEKKKCALLKKEGFL